MHFETNLYDVNVILCNNKYAHYSASTADTVVLNSQRGTSSQCHTCITCLRPHGIKTATK